MSGPVRFVLGAVVLAATLVPSALVGSASADEGMVNASRSWCC